jgi:hypothetical protein
LAQLGQPSCPIRPLESSSVKNFQAIDFGSETAAWKYSILPESAPLDSNSLQIGFVILCVGYAIRRGGRHEATGAS